MGCCYINDVRPKLRSCRNAQRTSHEILMNRYGSESEGTDVNKINSIDQEMGTNIEHD